MSIAEHIGTQMALMTEVIEPRRNIAVILESDGGAPGAARKTAGVG
jgi:hypothetical protein